MSLDTLTVNYVPSPTGVKFHNSHADIRIVLGNVGSGKSTMMIIELIKMAMLQRPDKNNERTTKWVIVRETYPQLLETTYASFKLWLKPNNTTRRYTQSAPMKIKWTDKLADGTRMNAEFIFMAVAKPEDYENLKSLELTGGFINECGVMDKEIVSAVYSRCGRYPAPVDAIDENNPITRVSLIMDTNPPEEDSWVQKIEENTPMGWAFFRQPGAVIRDPSEDCGYRLNPKGENFKYIGIGPKRYYLDRISTMTPEQVKVLFEGEYGVTSSGKAVYKRQWDHDYHIAKTGLRAIKGLPIILGWDWGKGGESCIIGQVVKSGQLRILQEFYGDNIGLREFAEDFVRPYLEEHFGPKTLEEGEKPWQILSIGDPAGLSSHGLAEKSRNYFHVLNDETVGVFRDWFTTAPAPSNHIELRLNAVRYFLTKKTNTGLPLFQIDKGNKLLIKGFNQSYEYERKQVTGRAQYKDVPCKSAESHPHDALQYLCLFAHPDYEQLKKHTEFVTRTQVKTIKNVDATNYA
jgi:hypothetical protein